MRNLNSFLIKYIKLNSMKQSPHQVSEKSLLPGHQSPTPNFCYIQGRSQSVKLLYRLFKYASILSVLVLIVVSGIAILGDTSSNVSESRGIFDVYKSSLHVNNVVDEINLLFERKSSKYISDRTVNLYLERKPSEDLDGERVDDRFDDLVHFVEFFVSEKYYGKNVLQLPLNLYEEKTYGIVPESHSFKLLNYLKKSLGKFLQKNKLTAPSSVKELKWTRVKKLIDNGKVDEIVELLKDNLLNSIWKWIENQPEVTVLIAGDSRGTEKEIGNKKLFNRWIKENQKDSDIIILSRYPVNNLYEINKEDHLKSYQISVNIDGLNQQALCNYLTQSLNLNQAQCSSLASRFNTLSQIEKFVDNFEQQQSVEAQTEEVKGLQILQEVCEHGHVHYYFYQGQQNAYNVLSRNKKVKKSRLDRQLQALIVKWSHLKRSMGLSKFKDIYLTLTSENVEEGNLTLREANGLGLVYDFDLHELRWSSEEEKMVYEVRTGSECKGRDAVEEEIRSEKEHQEQEENRKQIADKEVLQGEDQQTDEQEDQVEEQEYEQNFIHYDLDQEKVVQNSQQMDTNEEEEKVIEQKEQVSEVDKQEEQVSQVEEQQVLQTVENEESVIQVNGQEVQAPQVNEQQLQETQNRDDQQQATKESAQVQIEQVEDSVVEESQQEQVEEQLEDPIMESQQVELSEPQVENDKNQDIENENENEEEFITQPEEKEQADETQEEVEQVNQQVEEVNDNVQQEQEIALQQEVMIQQQHQDDKANQNIQQTEDQINANQQDAQLIQHEDHLQTPKTVAQNQQQQSPETENTQEQQVNQKKEQAELKDQTQQEVQQVEVVENQQKEQ